MTALTERRTQIDAVAACTAAAAHRRDHRHEGDEQCRPHVVEVVRLGVLGLAVCHDCGADSGFVPEREAEALSALHRAATEDAEAPLASLVPLASASALWTSRGRPEVGL